MFHFAYEENFSLAFLLISIIFLYILHDVPLFLYGVNAQQSCIKQNTYTYKILILKLYYLLLKSGKATPVTITVKTINGE
jgi:hypothetical protein